MTSALRIEWNTGETSLFFFYNSALTLKKYLYEKAHFIRKKKSKFQGQYHDVTGKNLLPSMPEFHRGTVWMRACTASSADPC